jgi:hypothetical protein
VHEQLSDRGFGAAEAYGDKVVLAGIDLDVREGTSARTPSSDLTSNGPSIPICTR